MPAEFTDRTPSVPVSDSRKLGRASRSTTSRWGARVSGSVVLPVGIFSGVAGNSNAFGAEALSESVTSRTAGQSSVIVDDSELPSSALGIAGVRVATYGDGLIGNVAVV